MQLLEHWDPLKLPRGSIRAIITLLLLGVLWALMLLGRDIHPLLGFVVIFILAYYFGARGGSGCAPAPEGAPEPPGERSPLYLPRGTVRVVILVGFAAVGYMLWSDGKLQVAPRDPIFSLILLPGALVVGFLVRGAADLLSRNRATTPRRWFENAKAVVALTATALFAVLCVVESDDPASDRALIIAAPIVCFYFGSRR